MRAAAPISSYMVGGRSRQPKPVLWIVMEVQPHQHQEPYGTSNYIINKPITYSWNYSEEDNNRCRWHTAMAILTLSIHTSLRKISKFNDIATIWNMFFNIEWVSGPEPRSSGGNTSSNPQVSALTPRPASNTVPVSWCRRRSGGGRTTCIGVIAATGPQHQPITQALTSCQGLSNPSVLTGKTLPTWWSPVVSSYCRYRKAFLETGAA